MIGGHQTSSICTCNKTLANLHRCSEHKNFVLGRQEFFRGGRNNNRRYPDWLVLVAPRNAGHPPTQVPLQCLVNHVLGSVSSAVSLNVTQNTPYFLQAAFWLYLPGSFWRFIISYVSTHATPTTLFVCGLVCNIIAAGITVAFAKSMAEALLRWVSILNAASILYALFSSPSSVSRMPF
jgi:hypothetical protein